MKVKNISFPEFFKLDLKNKIFIKDIANIFMKTGEIIEINNDLSIKKLFLGFFLYKIKLIQQKKNQNIF